jgi:hypothetical protein
MTNKNRDRDKRFSLRKSGRRRRLLASITAYREERRVLVSEPTCSCGNAAKADSKSSHLVKALPEPTNAAENLPKKAEEVAPKRVDLEDRHRDKRFSLRKSGHRRRLLASITAYRKERRVLVSEPTCSCGNAAKADCKSSSAAENLLKEAEEAVRKRANLDTGYACFLAARRVDILCLDDSRLRPAARSLLADAKGRKIRQWRKDAIVSLIEDIADEKPTGTRRGPGTARPEPRHPEDYGDGHSRLDDRRTRLQEATLLRDDDSQNTYRKIDTLKQHLLILSTVLFGTLILLFIAVRFSRSAPSSRRSPGKP